MRFKYTEWPSLPRLAWCACVRRGGDAVEVFHGPWVETRRDRFFEGAWDGPFEEGAFDQAASFFGSGAVLKDEGVLFVSATHPVDWLQITQTRDWLLASNSLPFLLCQAGDRLDDSFPRYYHLFVRHLRVGYPPGDGPFPTVDGSGFRFYNAANTLVRQDLALAPARKAPGPAPGDFHHLRSLLSGAIQRLAENAGHEGRRRSYRLVTPLSRGYDSPAVAALAAGAGCREAIAFVDRQASDPDADNGTPVGQCLGLQTTVYGKRDYLALDNVPEAEFCAGVSFGQRLSFAPLSDRLSGSLLLSGLGGDRNWGAAEISCMPDGRDPDAKPVGIAVKEFRLRIGCLVAPVPYITAHAHRAALRRIALSSEMQPWRLDTQRYNRPIPRRIAEEAGVPRELIGQKKQAGLNMPASCEQHMTKAGAADFRRFLETRVDPAALRQPRALMLLVSHYYDRLYRAAVKLPPGLFRIVSPFVGHPLREVHSWWWASPFLFTFQWGVDRTMERYRTPWRLGDGKA